MKFELCGSEDACAERHLLTGFFNHHFQEFETGLQIDQTNTDLSYIGGEILFLNNFYYVCMTGICKLHDGLGHSYKK